ncbi:General transcription and DNA repair factor IIH helicase subunit XPD [Balamuthia mandrillaris]
MKFYLEDLLVYFPYTYIYPEQYSYMLSLKRALDAKGPCVLEMPSGTGKTVSLLSLILSYQLAHPDVGKLVYCSRTVPEIEKVVEELRRVVAYRDEELGQHKPRFLGLALSARRNLCIHPRASEETRAAVVDSICRSMTASWVREQHGKRSGLQETMDIEDLAGSSSSSAGSSSSSSSSNVELCDFYEGWETSGRDALLQGVYSLEDLREVGKEHGWCPYFLARHLINFANVVVYSYQYILDPKISDLVSKEFKANSIVVFDEAHNIDNVCIDALSVNIDKRTLESSSRNLVQLSTRLQEIKNTDADRLRQEYQRLVAGLANTGIARIADEVRADPVLSDDVLKEVVPGNIRRGEHFLGLLRRFVEYLKTRLKVQQVVQESPLAFIQSCQQNALIQQKTLRFTAARLGSLLRTLEITDMGQFHPISLVCDFATLVGTYYKGFAIVIEPYDPRFGSSSSSSANPVLQFSCLDASIAMRPVVSRFRSVVITSGTLSPLEMYPRVLDFQPVLSEKFPMTLNRSCVCPLVVTRGSDQVAVSTKYDVRSDPSVVRNYADLLIHLSAVVPDGIVVFFTSYRYMEEIVALWNEMKLLEVMLQNKLLFVETPDALESTLALANYRKACESGRGAILFSVARGKISEGIDFDHHYGRAVVLIGIPYMNTESKILRARLEFLRENYQIREAEFLTFDAMRTAAQCVGRVIRGKNDYGIMVFADKRYNRLDKRNKLPKWIADYMQHSHLNLSTDMAMSLAKTFLKEMAQPFSQQEQLGTALWTVDIVEQQPCSRPRPSAPQ